MSDEPRLMWVWTDFQTTGSDLNDLKPLEIGIVVTDTSLQQFGSPFTQVIKEPREFVELMKTECDPSIVDAHEASGLWAEVETFGSPVREVERLVVGTIRAALVDAGLDPDQPETYQLQMAGSDVSRFHKFVAASHMHDFYSMLTVRDLEISSLQLSAEIYFNDLMPRILRRADSPPRSLAAALHHLKTYAMFVQYVRQLGDVVANLGDDF